MQNVTPNDTYNNASFINDSPSDFTNSVITFDKSFPEARVNKVNDLIEKLRQKVSKQISNDIKTNNSLRKIQAIQDSPVTKKRQ